MATRHQNGVAEVRYTKDDNHDAEDKSPHPLRRDVQVQLQYLKDDPLYALEKPVQITPNFLDKDRRTNVKLAAGQPETIRDVRGQEERFSLDDHGFRYIKAPTSFKEWSSQPAIAQRYLPELEVLLKRAIDGCDEIIFYDARIRHSDDAGLRVEGLSYNPFAKQVHTDNTERSVLAKIRNLTEIKADYLLSGRARIINIWRPIKHPVYDCGLAVANGSKLRDTDILECERHRADTNEYWDTMGVVKYRPGFEWYYCSEQDEEDVLLFKNYDSARSVLASTVLHTAFDMPPEIIPAGAPTRESIEVRALVFTYPEHGRRPSLIGQPSPHPLAESLERGLLTRVDEEHSITDRVRTDIDEGNEVKDAVLLLRRQEIRRLEALQETLVKERDSLTTQLDIQTKRIQLLESQMLGLSQQLRQHEPDLRRQIQRLSAELVGVRLGHEISPQAFSEAKTITSVSSNEWATLYQQLETLKAEVQKWKYQALSRGSPAVSQSHQAAVDEAVRREREKDAGVVEELRREVQQLTAWAAQKTASGQI